MNLSGRNSNPFAAYGASKPSTTVQTAHGAVAHAQQERILREQERRRPPAAIKIQKTWRGYKGRRDARRQWAELWESREAWGRTQASEGYYETETECFEQLRLLAHFASSKSQSDIQRIGHFAKRYLNRTSAVTSVPHEAWIQPSARLTLTILRILRDPALGKCPEQTILDLVELLTSLTKVSADLIAKHSLEYYQAVNQTARYCDNPELLRGMVLALLQGKQRNLPAVYDGFSWVYLVQESLPGFGSDTRSLSTYVNYQALAAALAESLPKYQNSSLLEFDKNDGLLWLLAYFTYFHQHPGPAEHRTPLPDASYIKVVSRLISALADDVGERIDAYNMNSLSGDVVTDGETPVAKKKILPKFVRTQILSLVSQENVSGLLAKLDTNQSSFIKDGRSSGEASALASYVLTLLRVFPKRRSDIQLWLYRGSVMDQSGRKRKLPATKYLYQASQATSLFKDIATDPENSLRYLAPRDHQPTLKTSTSSLHGIEDQNQEWRVILLFLELFSFTLQVMDDEEFLAGREEPDPEAIWTKQSALPIQSIRYLTVFLKNLAFALYWYGSRLTEQKERKTAQGLAAYFGRAEATEDDVDEDDPNKLNEKEVGGISGMTLTSMKGVVTAVLRMIYQRE